MKVINENNEIASGDYELTSGFLDIKKDDIGLLIRQDVQPRTVMSLTDYWLNNIFNDGRMRKLSEADAANQSMNILVYHITTMSSAAMCYAPVKKTDEQYEMPTVDIQEMTSIGVAMAMLIMSTMQNEIMLDTQLEAVKGTQNQKLSASQKKMLQIRQQVRKSRYKSPFQKFMESLSNSWIMKFLNSNYGKIIMFIIGAAVTIASFGSAGPAVIAISSMLLAFQAAELIMGKSMGELITSGMDDGTAKMAIQMSIDIGLMVAGMATGGGGAAKVDQAADAAAAAADAAQTASKVAKQVRQVSDAAEQVSKMTDVTNDVASAAQNVTKAANEAAEAAESVTKAADVLSDALKNGESITDVAEKTKSLQKAMNALTDKTNELKNAVQKFDEVTEGLTDGAVKIAAGNVKKLAGGAMESLQEAKNLGEKAIESAQGLLGKFENLGDKIDNASDELTKLKEQQKGLQDQLDALAEGADKTDLTNQLDDVNKQIVDKTDELKSLVQKADLEDIKESADSIECIRKNAKEQLDTLSGQIDDVIKNSGDDITGDALAELEQVQKKVGDLSKRLEDGTTTIFDAQKEMKDIQSKLKNIEKLDGFTKTNATEEALKNLIDQADDIGKHLNVANWKTKIVKSTLGRKIGKSTFGRAASSMGRGASSAARFVAGIKGLEHLSFVQQMTIALQKFQQRIQILMQTYQALYQLAASEEEARKITYAAEVEAINSKDQARQDFYQMLIDNQMSDIQSLLSYTKASFARAAEVIREYGDTNQMIARNLVI